MNGPAIMPWLRKKDRISVLSRESIVRTLRTPARRKFAQIASSSRVPIPVLARARFDVDGEYPAAGRRSEFPVAHLADHESGDLPVAVSDEELTGSRASLAVTLVHGSPVAALGDAGDRCVEGNDALEILPPHRPDRDGGAGRRRPGHGPPWPKFAFPVPKSPRHPPKTDADQANYRIPMPD